MSETGWKTTVTDKAKHSARHLRVLIGCEVSGTVRRAFRALGHDAWSADLQPAADHSPFHIVCGHDLHLLDISDNGTWDIGIFHPPCTRLANSGALRLYRGGKKCNGFDQVKMDELNEAAAFFKALWNCKINRICIENPIQHCHAKKLIGADWTQTIQPWQFGHPESERTCLWLRGLPMLKPTKVLPQRKQLENQTPSGQNKLSPGLKAVTYPGIGQAMAAQWSNIS